MLGEKMKIKDIEPGMSNITITARVTSVSKPRRVSTKYGETMVAQATIADETGEIILNLWRNQIDMVKPGDIIKIENAYSKEYKGRIELNIGKNGKIVVLEHAKSSKLEEEIEDEENEIDFE
jgi:replication factor A1